MLQRCKHINILHTSGVQANRYCNGYAGSVCILGAATAEAEAAVQRIVARYAEETGFSPYEFRGTSIGANRFGHMCLQRPSQ